MQKDFTREKENNKQVDVDLKTFFQNIPGGAVRLYLSEETSIEYISDGLLMMLECNREQFLTFYHNSIEAVFCMEELNHLIQKWKDQQANHAIGEVEHYLYTYTGEKKWVLSKYELKKDKDEKLLLYLVCIDITDMKKSRTELEKEREKCDNILKLNFHMMYEYNHEQDSITFTRNRRFGEQNGVTIKNCKDKLRFFVKIHRDDQKKFYNFLKEKENGELEFRYINANGENVWCLARSIVLKDEYDNITSTIGSISNIDRQKREHDHLREQSKRDALTSLFNKKNAQEEIEQVLIDSKESSSHALMIIDIDNFKAINDNLGHLFGDAVLTNIADNLKDIFLPTDILGRIGGDEFIAFLSNVSDEAVIEQKASRIAKDLETLYIGENKEITISCSIGISRYPKDGQNYQELFRKADVALYYAKNKGKNCFSFYDEECSICPPIEESEFLNQYQLDMTEQNGFTKFDREITNFAFDLMAKTKDVNSAIHLLLDKVGRQFGADSIRIIEFNHKNNIPQATYLWYKNEGFSDLDSVSRIYYQNMQKNPSYFDENGIYSASDISKVNKDSLGRAYMEQIGAIALLQCAYYDDGILKGCVSLEDNKKTRYWTKYEVDSLVTITKLLSAYLLKIRLSESIQEKLDQIKNFDSVTGLPSLHRFKKDAEKLVITHPDETYAIIYLDINNFKYINETYGYEIGDSILREFACFLIEQTGKPEYNTRMSADNFITITKFNSEEELEQRIIQMSRQFSKRLKGKHVNCNTVVISGVCIIKDWSEVMLAIDNANLARKTAKLESKETCLFYNDIMKEKVVREIEMTNSMEEALEKGEFQVYLQPKVNLYDNSRVGAEALARWIKSTGEMISPVEFIPLFEKNGFIVKLDFYIYETVCKTLRSWMQQDIPIVPISVNVSRVHLTHEDFVTKVKRLVDSYEIPYHYLELELTESIFLSNTEAAIRTMRELRELGFVVSIDDFGSGYSSLNMLKDITSDVLKLDKEFFRQGEMQQGEKIIVSSIIGMAKQLNMKVLSEGVETETQREFLKDIDCDMAQGFLFSKPMPIYEFEQTL